MKRFNPVYYLLFILLVMGAFASMAQNRYGLKIIGLVAFAFGIVFLAELFSVLKKKQPASVEQILEPLCLFIVAVIFGLRVFYIHFPFIEWVFVFAVALLAVIYLRRMLKRFKQYRYSNFSLALLVLDFHLGILLFLLSLILVPFFPKTAEWLSALGFLFVLAFVITGLVRKSYIIEGEKMSSFIAVRNFRDHSVHIVTFFLLFSLYVGLYRLGVIPGIYSDELPRAYYDMVNKASLRKEKTVENKYKYELFKEKYDAFIDHVKKYSN